MRRLTKSLLLLFIVMLPLLLGNPTQAQNAIIINPQFDFLRQGTVGIITISGPGITGAGADVFDRTYPFFSITQGFASFLAVDWHQKIQDYPLTVTLTMQNGDKRTWTSTVKVQSGGFVLEDPFTLPQEKAYLLSDQVQTNEDNRLKAIYDVLTPERYWEGPLVPPSNGPEVSPFGGIRTFNGIATRQHTGVDLRATEGTPVLASGNGRVVYSHMLDIHGNNIIIDHGWGVYTEYAHLSQRYVVPGQMVLQGDLIGLSGTTGRATGPHLHWEISVNGVWVDPLQFSKLKLPT